MITFNKDGHFVKIRINSGLNVKYPVYIANIECTDENYAELLTEQLNKEMYKYRRQIARECYLFLDKEELKKLKKKN